MKIRIRILYNIIILFFSINVSAQVNTFDYGGGEFDDLGYNSRYPVFIEIDNNDIVDGEFNYQNLRDYYVLSPDDRYLNGWVHYQLQLPETMSFSNIEAVYNSALSYEEYKEEAGGIPFFWAIILFDMNSGAVIGDNLHGKFNIELESGYYLILVKPLDYSYYDHKVESGISYWDFLGLDKSIIDIYSIAEEFSNYPNIGADLGMEEQFLLRMKATLVEQGPEPKPDFNLSLSQDQNYIHTRIYTTKGGVNEGYMDHIQYFDGLGRLSQNIQAGMTPEKQDLVILQEYDVFGRESKSWLPSISTGQGAYVNPTNIQSSSKNLNNDSAPFSKPVYEASPLNRVLEQYGPGEAWQVNKKSAKSAYLTNIAGVDSLNCIYYMTTLVHDSVIQVSYVRPYDTGELYVTRVEDEDDRASFEFKDKLGQVILTRQIQRNGNTKTYLDTYYIYDDFGNLTAVLPPMASAGMKSGKYSSEASKIIREYAYLYQYDHRNRCIAKKLPGCEWIFYIYDQADQLIFSQDGNQRKNNEWSFSIPDVFGRVSFSGISKNGMNPFSPPLNETVVKAERSDAGTYKGYNLTGLTLVSPTIYTVNYYDDYSFMGKNGIPSETDTNAKYETSYESDGFGKRYITSAKGLLTGTLSAQLDGTTATPSYLYSVMYYDNRSRVVQIKSNNHLGGVEKNYFGYDFTGQPVKQKHVHTFGSNTQTNLYTYTYDHAGRLLTTKHQLNDGPTVVLADNQYDELGRLIANKRNGQGNLKTEYAYNIRSWTKSIKGKLFNQTLYYNDKRSNGTNKPSYSGNISAMDWMAGETKQRGYDFEYNEQSMLTKGHYLEGSVRNTKFNTSYSYDMHGNMLTLNRYGNTGTTQYGLIDSLSLSYRGNQLIKVDDMAADPTLNTSMDFKNTKEQEVEYAYDKNGNLVKDSNKGITDIQYNSLNLPRKVSFKSGHSTEYIYSSGGQKLSVIHKSATQKKTDYVGDLIYENGILKRILVDGGYIENGNYYFYLTDHLGNNRVVADATGNVMQVNHYYPFGASFAEGVQNTKQPYKYNGKDLDQENGLNLYDYSARQMEPAIGRFTRIDPMVEKYYSISPYAYVANNPINAIDPDGKLIIFVNGLDPIERAKHIAIQDVRRSDLKEEFIPYNEYADRSFKSFDNYGWGGLDEFYKSHYKDKHALYANGSYELGSKASTRYNGGIAKAKELIKMLDSGEITLAKGEKIRLVGYSMGAAYAAGMAHVLANSSYAGLLDIIDYVAPHQPEGFEHDSAIFGRQFGSSKDRLSGRGKKIKNIDDLNHHIGDFGSLFKGLYGHSLGENSELNKFIMDVIQAGGTVTVY